MNLFNKNLDINDSIPTELYTNRKTKRRSWNFISDDGIEHEMYLRELPLGLGGLGAQSWDAAFILTQWLAANASNLKNKVTLELGAGCALPSIFASRYTKKSYATEYLSTLIANEEYGAFINSNADEDDSEDLACLKANSSSAFHAAFFDWENPRQKGSDFGEEELKLLPPRQYDEETSSMLQKRFMIPNEQFLQETGILGDPQEMIGLGSELIYSQKNLEILHRILTSFLKNPKNVFYHILSDNRDYAAELHDMLRNDGFCVERVLVSDSYKKGIKSLQRDESYSFYTYYTSSCDLIAGQ